MNSPTRTGLLIVLSAPSGGGKTTLCNQLVETDPLVARVVTCTTRAPRKGETDRVDYFFLTEANFLERIQAGAMLEHAQVHGHYYGTLKSEVERLLAEGKDALLNVDVQGAAALKAAALRDAHLERALVAVFLVPSSTAVLQQRLIQRGTDTHEVIARRLAGALDEISRWHEYDYLIVSTTREEDLRRMQVILEAERMRSARALLPAEFTA